MPARARELHAFLSQRAQILPFEREWRASGLAGVQDLFDRLQQPLAVLEHHAVELAAAFVAHRVAAREERFEMQADRRDGRLQLVRHGIHERVVLLIPPDLAHEECRVQDEARDDRGKQEDAQEERRDLLPGHHDPADVEPHGERDQRHTERDEERDRAAAAGTTGMDKKV